MTSPSNLAAMTPRERGDYGFARARDIAFDAVQTLWRRRRSEGMRQTDIVKAIGRQPAWVSRNLRAPGNWTLRTIGELIEALDGELEIIAHPLEELPEKPRNYSAYAGYETKPPPKALEGGNQVVVVGALAAGGMAAGQVITQ